MFLFNFHHVESNILHPDRKHITITPDGLASFIRTLRKLGISVISLRDVLNNPELLTSSARLAILTFDDGYENVYREAVPILEAEKCPATIFVLAGKFSGTNDWDQGNLPAAQRDKLMSLEQMKALQHSSYVTFGSHGLHHVNCSQVEETRLIPEITESYNILSQELGSAFLPVFAYPWGSYNDKTLSVMADSKYRYALTTDKGRWTKASNPFTVPRYSAYYRDGNFLILLAKLLRNGLLFT